MNTRIHQARWLWGLAELDVFVESRELTESYVSKTFLGAWMRPNTLAAAGFTASLVTVSYLLSGTDLFPRTTSKSCRFWHMLSQNIAAAWTSHHQQPFETLVQNKWHSVDLSTQPSFPVFDPIQVMTFAEKLYGDTASASPLVIHSVELPAPFPTQHATNLKAIN